MRSEAKGTSARLPGTRIDRGFPAWLPWGVMAILLVSGCGLKTPPRPAEEVIPPLEGLQGRARPEGLLLSWPSPAADLPARFGPVESFRLRLAFQPMYCAPCPPEREMWVELAADDPALTPMEGRMYFLYRLPGEAGLWRVTLTAGFEAGDAGEGPPILVERRAEIPVVELNWNWVDPEGRRLSVPATGSPQLPADTRIRFSWNAPREGYRRVHGTDGKVVETVRYFRGNLYRLLPGKDWAYLPLNPEPLEGGGWELPAAVLAEGTAYRLRLVDRNGGEGAPSSEVTPLPGRTRP